MGARSCARCRTIHARGREQDSSSLNSSRTAETGERRRCSCCLSSIYSDPLSLRSDPIRLSLRKLVGRGLKWLSLSRRAGLV